jgi:P-type Ca2+ transporter type 2C
VCCILSQNHVGPLTSHLARIRTQVANAFVARRINYEYDFFRNVLKGPIFMSIMVLITVLQVIIMQTPISFVFKV